MSLRNATLWFVILGAACLAAAPACSESEISDDPSEQEGDAGGSETTDRGSSGGEADEGGGGGEAEAPRAPFRRELTALFRAEELALFLPGFEADKLGRVWDDEAEEGVEEEGGEQVRPEIGSIAGPLGVDTYSGRLLESFEADLDADGKDELAVLTLYTREMAHEFGNDFRHDYLRLSIFDDADNGFAELKVIDEDDYDISMLDTQIQGFHEGDVAWAEVDGTAGLEIVLIGTYGQTSNTGHVGYQNRGTDTVLWVFDDPGGAFELLETNTKVGSGTYEARMDAGDVDGDGLDEIVITGRDPGDDRHYTKAWLLDDGVAGYKKLRRWHNELDFVFEYRAQRPNVTVADFDRDGNEEIAFLMISYDGQVGTLAIYDDAETGYALTKNFGYSSGTNMKWNSQLAAQMAAGDFDGDGATDLALAFHDQYAGSQDRGWEIHVYYPSRDAKVRVTKTARKSEMHMVAGDTDRDGKDELYLAYSVVEKAGGAGGFPLPGDDQDALTAYRIEQWEPEGADKMKKAREWTRVLPEAEDLPPYDPYGPKPKTRPLLAIGDSDGDNTVVRYTGKHWTAVSHPRLVIAMALPPGWGSGVAQDNENNTWVGYGQVREASETEGNQISVSASVTLSVEAGDPFGIVEASASTTLSHELAKTQTESKTISTGVKQIANWSSEPDNVVVFVATEYERFEYEVVTHDDPEQIGRKLTLDVPIRTSTFKKSVTAFNDQNGDGPDIGEETFGHTLGDPKTYPTESDRDAILKEHTGWATPAAGEPLHVVGETSGGGTEVFIEIAKESTTAEERSIGVETSVGFKVGGVGAEASVGVTNTSIYEISVAEATEYAGAVGDIASKDYADKSYSFGMFVYNFVRDDGVGYQVINWVVGR